MMTAEIASCKKEAAQLSSELSAKLSACDNEREHITMELFELKQEFRIMNINISNNYQGRCRKAQNGGKRNSMMLRKCRNDLDYLAQLWSTNS